MSRTSTTRSYGGRRTTAGSRTRPMLFQTELPISPTDRRRRKLFPPKIDLVDVDDLTEQLTFVSLDDALTLDHFDVAPPDDIVLEAKEERVPVTDNLSLQETTTPARTEDTETTEKEPTEEAVPVDEPPSVDVSRHDGPKPTTDESHAPPLRRLDDHIDGHLPDDSLLDDSYYHEDSIDSGLRVLTWADLCPPGDRIEKIAEASYAEVYRVTNERGTSIIKTIRLASPIKAQTKAQVRSGLVDEEPHDEEDLRGELTISEWLADIPGFVVYKERYIVRGRAPKDLLETHQTFHRRAKRQDPDRLQFYPSPSRYLDDTRFLVIELGDAGRALEDTTLDSVSQLWDVFLHVAIALARAEDQIHFEHRDLHEGNLCVRQVAPPRCKDEADDSPVVFGFSGLDITILDYGLSRGEDVDDDDRSEPIACDLEKDLSLFTSTHAEQCKVYRQMRSHLLKGDRVHLPPDCHGTPYDAGPDGAPISWKDYHPYTNVLWLAYLYEYLVRHYCGDKSELAAFRRATRELWLHMSPDAPPAVLSFPSATDIVRFAVEAGWLTEAQLIGGGGVSTEDSFFSRRDRTGCTTVDISLLLSESVAADESTCGGSESIIEAQIVERDELEPRRSPRRRRPVVRYGD
ncbi:uncharacterized protein SPSK_04108 [Sporothrix schenckii 1099-18]|uniref:non-specific serine/threonine protein kinase n=1 Tax=Sporothrix schenckii 1099-18 TaxID=1397361 RepID=A0A0F2M1J4_SPOSC|nr:uncharacterized protein SPSK_04108 [Sporothrix schenckii 1099-18]KJR82949.1 hypothetical protein SPSK_04108 [Sporothrix schenckii 1099-18]